MEGDHGHRGECPPPGPTRRRAQRGRTPGRDHLLILHAGRKWKLWIAGSALTAAALGLYAKNAIEENAVPPGSPQAAGRILMERKRCVRCHKIAGEGGLVGPDLTVVALRKEEAWMFNYLADPRAINPKAKMPKPRLTPEQRAAIVAYLRTLDGRGGAGAVLPNPGR